MACSKPFQRREDFISNILDIVYDKILEHLPISIAAQTSVLSKQWRRAWLSIKKLNFDADFWKVADESYNWQTCSSIISSVLFHHNGPVHDFHLCIPSDTDWDGMNMSQWISFLSKNGVQKIVICSGEVTDVVDISSYIFSCSELVHLNLNGFYLNPPPTDFNGFTKLKHLVLDNIAFVKQNIFSSLIEICRMLETLQLVEWGAIDHIVIDAPSLRSLIIKGDFESLALTTVRSLESITVHLNTSPKNPITAETVATVNLLASSCQLQSMEFNGHLCKLLSASGIIRSTTATFNCLEKLCLSNINLNDFGVFSYLLSMIECCPYIRKLDISVTPGKIVEQYIIVDFNYNYKLDHLREIIISGITGSSEELKLVEYLLAISASLENLFFKAGKCRTDSELKMSRALMRFPRASTKASIVCLDT